MSLTLFMHGAAAQLSDLPSSVQRVIIDLGANTDPILPPAGDAAMMTLAFEPIVHNQIRASSQLMVVPAAVAAQDAGGVIGALTRWAGSGVHSVPK